MHVPTTSTIVFFDGYCGLCNGVVDFLIVRDAKRRLRYAPLQGETAEKMLSTEQRIDLNTVVVVAGERRFIKSSAVLFTLKELGGLYKVVGLIGHAVPQVVRDSIYDVVAQNRYGWFGRRDSCRLPTPDERIYFLP